MDEITKWIRQVDAEPESHDALGILRAALSRFGERVALASSLGVEDQVLLHMMMQLGPRPRVFTLDTGRLPQETYDLIATTEEEYGIRFELVFPERKDLEQLAEIGGPNLFYNGIEHRRACCRTRKVLPLRRKLAELDAWVTGLRREQSPTRERVVRVEWDVEHGLVKLNPLVNWTTAAVWDYVRANAVPVNRLHGCGYQSIGCAPCTRPVKPGEEVRAGRWWWERPEHKECGLHVRDGKLVRQEKGADGDDAT